MNKKSIFTLVIGLVLVSLLSACAGQAVALPGQQPTPRTLSVSGYGEVFIAPDIAYINIGVQTRSETVKDALSINNAQAKAIADALMKLGVEAKDIQTSSFNVYPLQEYGPAGEVLRNLYVVDNIVYVTVRDLQKLGDILDQVVQSGANTINSISFDIQDKVAAQAKARELAIADARKQAEEIAAAAGIKLGDITNISVYGNYTPMPTYEGKGGNFAASVPVSAGQLMMTMTASITYEIK